MVSLLILQCLARREKCRNRCFILQKKKKRKVSLTDCKLKCFSSQMEAPPPQYINPPIIGPSNLPFVHIYAQSVLTEFYGIIKSTVWAFFSISLHVTITRYHLPFCKIFSNFAYFCPDLQILRRFLPFSKYFARFLPFFEKLHAYLYFLE